MPYPFSHCATRYDSSRQLERCPAESLVRRLAELGVEMNSVVDFGTGTGFWLDKMAQAGWARGRNFAIDISPEMLARARTRIENATFIQGDIDVLESADIEGADCIFLCMVAHLLNFPSDIARLIHIARKKMIPHLVIIEEVSLYYHAFVGNPHYVELLPNGVGKVISSYMRLRTELGCPGMARERAAPFPMPSLSNMVWNKMGVDVSRYHFETPANIGWTWLLSPADVVHEIRNRGYSVCFCHDSVQAERIAKEIEEEFRDNGTEGDYKRRHEIVFWFNVHVFAV